MTDTLYLSLLFPYALVLIWVVKKLNFAMLPTLLLCIVTMGVVWAIFYAAVYWAEPDPELAFASVEEIMHESNYDWYLRYIAELWGWFAGLVFFWCCWAIAWAFFRIIKT